jgi:hypothetical protein
MMITGHYTRMFPQLARQPSSTIEEGLAELGAAMKDNEADPGGDGQVAAGVTYFGQFIDHDLTLDLTPLDYAHPFPERTRNHRTPFLDLDHVYGGGPNLSPFLYTMAGPPGTERFLIGSTRKVTKKVQPQIQTFAPSLDDLPRNKNGIALVGDPRQDENLILAQLHVAFLKLHNFVMDELAAGRVESVGPAGGTLFEQTRRLVVWTYQYIVLNDFLPAVTGSTTLPGEVQKLAVSKGFKPGPFSIPIEFSTAAFRFGHSMVRDTYPYNRNHSPAKLGDLLKQTGPGGGAAPALPADWVIDWTRFFNLGGPFRVARKFDTGIAETLHNLQIPTVKLYKSPRHDEPPGIPSPKDKLPVRTLWRGARVGLPSGQDIAKVFAIKNPLMQDDIAKGPHSKILTRHGFHRDTPLWYYILKEAELGGGMNLGPLGGRLVADVVTTTLRADPNSYLSIHPNWKPVLKGQEITNMAAIPDLTRLPLAV